MQGVNIVWRDVVLIILLCVVGIVMIQLPHINPVAEDTEREVDTQGELAVSIGWMYGVDIDVDVWVRTPSNEVISYRNKHRHSGDLLRDDLGTGVGQGDANFEVIYIRDLSPGEYVINVHLFGLGDQRNEIYLPLSVDTRITSIKDGSSTKIHSSTIELKNEKEERTVVAFNIDDEGNVVRGSMSRLPVRLIYSQ